MKIDILRIFFRFYLNNKTMSTDKIDMSSVNNILVMSNTAIGDTLFATSSLRLIKERYPNKKIIILLNPNNYKLFITNPYIDNFELFNGKWRSFFAVLMKLRKFEIDVVLIMNGNEPQATPLAYCTGARYIIRVPNINNEFNHLHFNEPISRNYKRHTIHTRLKQLEYIGIRDNNYEMELFPKTEWYKPFNLILNKNYQYIGIQTGASTISRMWFNKQWVLLAQKILESNNKVRIVLTGSPGERSLTKLLEQAINNKRVLNLAGKYNICSAAVLIGSLDLLITPDTGPLQIAAALKVPTIAISVASSASSTNPIDPDVPHIYIQKPKTCIPCIDRRCKNQFCMLQISVEEVFEKAVDLLKVA